jgi:hypothetical protein
MRDEEEITHWAMVFGLGRLTLVIGASWRCCIGYSTVYKDLGGMVFIEFPIREIRHNG